MSLIRKMLPSIYKRIIYRDIDNTKLESLLLNRKIEPDILLLNRYIKKDQVCFDIGANVGSYTYQFEKLVGPENVFSFEPIPSLYSNLSQIFKKVHCYNCALSDKEETVLLKIPIINGQKYYTRAKLDRVLEEPDETGSEDVSIATETLDNFVRKNKIAAVHFVKIDVEGHEFSVLRGGEGVFSMFKPILLVEIEQRHHAFSINQIFEFIKKMGYEIKYFNLEKNDFLGLDSFSVETDQDYEKIKTQDYINNFWCFPIIESSKQLSQGTFIK